jgi:hypothetical protein
MLSSLLGRPKTRPARRPRKSAYENRLARIEADIAMIKTQMVTKSWVFAQTFILLGGVAALIRLLH